ncbi:MAG: TonB-dependent receptor [Vulcanimicrobiota bacterium]
MKPFLAAICCVMLCMGSVLAAQVEGDLLIEVVKEADESPVADAVVTVKNREGTRTIQEVRTGPDGKARVKNLPLGDYLVEVTHPEVGRDSAIVKINPATDNNFTAYLVASDEPAEVLEVRGDRLLVNSKDPSSGATTRRDGQFLERQLTNGNSLQAVLSTAPGVQTNSVGQVHVRGEHKALTLSLDGVDVPVPTESSITQPLDPEFLDQIEVGTGNYDASKGGQLGVVVNATTETPDEPFVKLEARAGDKGQSEFVLKAGGANEDKTFSYFVGARHRQSDLYLEPPHPDQQTLNNHGELTSLLLRLNSNSEHDKFGLTLSHQNADLGIPQTPANFTAGVRQQQSDANTLILGSWKHEFSPETDMQLGLAFLRSRQKVNNNGVFTNFTAVSPAVDEELAEEGFPADPASPGSPYLPSSDLEVSQFQPSLEVTHRLGENERLKAGLTANFINSRQSLDITDPGGGGGLPNPAGLPGAVTRFRANLDRDAFIGGLFVSHTLPLSETITLNYGLRADTFDNGLGVNTGQLSPRVNLIWGPTETQAVRLSYNRLFQPPPLELDTSGQTQVLPQRTHAYELSYENQFAKNVVGKIAFVYKDYTDQIDVGLLIPNSNIPVFAPINFARARYQGVELSVNTFNELGWNGFLSATIGEAKPTVPGVFTTEFPEYNDHDQRVQVTGGTSYTWENGLSAGVDFLYGSGFPQEALPLYNAAGINPFGLTGDRLDRFITNLNIQYLPENKAGPDLGFGLQVFNVFDDRSLLNFLSEFSGTRFVQGRRFLFNGQVRF